MSDKVLKSALKFANSNPELLAGLSRLPELLKNKLPENIGLTSASGITESVIPDIIKESPSKIVESVDILNTIFNMKVIFTIALLIWAGIMISSVFAIQDKETKENVKYTHHLLFGGHGIVPLIASLWIISIILVTMIPAIIDVLPQMSTLFSSLSSAIITYASK